MIIYTVQNPEVLEILKRDGVVYPLPVLDDASFTIPYQWMYKQLKEHNIPLNKNNGGIFWGGTDERETIYFSGTLMVLDIPESELLMSDFMGWHFVLNDYPFVLDDSVNCNEISQKDKEKSWLEIFKIKYSDNSFTYGELLLKLNEGNVPIVQVCFTQIKKEWLKEYKFVNKVEISSK